MATAMIRTPSTPKQVSALLNEIQTGVGVTGAFVCDHRGVTLGGIGAYFTAGRNWNECDRISLCVVQIVAALQARAGKWRELELSFERQVLFVRDLENALLVVFCERDINRSLLRMSMNVAGTPFEKDANLQKAIGAGAPSRLAALQERYLADSAWHLIQKTGLVNG